MSLEELPDEPQAGTPNDEETSLDDLDELAAALGLPNEEEDEEPAIPKIHPAAADGVEVEVPDHPEEKYFIGMWGDLRNYACPYCPYATIGTGEPGSGNGAVELHILAKIDSGDINHRAALVIEE